MRLVRYALAFGLGYAVGHPDGRAKLRAVPGQINELAQRPEAQKLRDRGKTVTDQAVHAAKQRFGRGTSEEGSAKPPVVAEETVVVTEPTGATTGAASGDPDLDRAMHGNLPPAAPRRSQR